MDAGPERRSFSLPGHGEISLSVGDTIEDRGSVFQATCAFPILSVPAAVAAQAYLRGLKEEATHNMTAYRIRSTPVAKSPKKTTGKSKKDAAKWVTAYDDDGENNGGPFLLPPSSSSSSPPPPDSTILPWLPDLIHPRPTLVEPNEENGCR
jgi:hypothetical protein